MLQVHVFPQGQSPSPGLQMMEMAGVERPLVEPFSTASTHAQAGGWGARCQGSRDLPKSHL